VNHPEFATHWASELGSSEETLVPLRGGMNNYVFRCGIKLRRWVIKGYPKYEIGKPDRMQSEIEFLQYANQVAPTRVPELIAIDKARRCVVLEYIEGSGYPEGVSPPAGDVKEALEFFRLLNADMVVAMQNIHLDAAEGFPSLTQHMANVYERIALMRTEHLPRDFVQICTKILSILRSDTEDLADILYRGINNGNIDDFLDPKRRCVSPSDFGFHNAIRTKKCIKFIDFEFAGWDDPSKVCCDFTLQQRNPINASAIHIHAALFSALDRKATMRLLTMHRILRLKWACIVMNILNPDRFQSLLAINKYSNPESLVSLQISRLMRHRHLRIGLEI